MYKKIAELNDKKHFGTQTIIYKCEQNFLVVILGRDGVDYYFIDLEIKNLYPANSYMKAKKFSYENRRGQATLECHFDIDLSKYGCSKCPPWLREILISNTD